MIVLVVGFVDDTRSLGPRVKLLGQAAAVLVLYFGGVRIRLDRRSSAWTSTSTIRPSTLRRSGAAVDAVALPSLLVTLLWFLGCMNIWNLIDGMDGLASGVGLLVSGTLTLVAIHNENFGAAVLAVGAGRAAWRASCSITGIRPASSWATAAAC